MAKRRGTTRERQARKDRAAMARLERVDDDTLRLRSFWSPLPNWAFGAGGAALFALGGTVAELARGGEEPTRVMALLAAAGYIVGAIIWAILGTVGGDRLEVQFDRREGRAAVHQSLLWTWVRDFAIDLEEAEALHVVEQRGRFLFKLSSTYTLILAVARGSHLRLGRFSTRAETDEIARPLAQFLGLRVEEGDPPEEKRG